MNKNPDRIIESYEFVLGPPMGYSPRAAPTRYHIRFNDRQQEFTIPGQIRPYYVGREEEGGFLREADSLEEAQKVLVKVIREELGKALRGFIPLLETVARLSSADYQPTHQLSPYKIGKEKTV